jgi:hypothetical protein
LVLFDARPEVPSVFLFPVGGGSRGGGYEEGVTDDVEAGIMGTLPMAMSLPPTAVGSGIAGEPVAGLADDVEAGIMGTLPMAMSLPPIAVGSGIAGEPVAGMAGLEMSETDWRRRGDGDSEERGVTGRGEAGHDGAGEGGRERAEIEGASED